MLHKIIIILILGAAISLVSLDLCAQTEEPVEELTGGVLEAPVKEPLEEPADLELLFDPQEGSSELSAVKEKIRFLLRQNTQLSDQARSLKQESLELREKLRQARAAVVAPAKDQAPEIEKQENLQQKTQNVPEAGKSQSLQQLRLYDLQYQEKELELELKLKELALREKRLARERQLAGSRKDLEQNAAPEKRLTDEARVFKDSAALAYELEFLKQENILLEDQLRSPRALSGSGGISPESGAVGETIRRKEEERDRLARVIEELKTEQGFVFAPAADGFSVFEARFRDSVKVLEEENRQLKNKIFSFKEKIQN